MAWAVTIDTVTITPPTDAQVDAVMDALAEYDGVVSMSPDRIGCTFTTTGANTVDAGERATSLWRDRLLDAGIVPGVDVSLEVITTDERDRWHAS